MTTQQRNPEMVNLLKADLQGRYEPQFALANTMALMKALPGLRGFWPMSAIDSSGNALDQSSNVRTLTYNGNPTYNYAGLAPYIALDGTGDFLNRTDEAGLDILGTETYLASAARGLTMGGWFWFDAAVGGSSQALMGKDNTTTNRSYSLLRLATTGAILFGVSTDGSTYVNTNTAAPDNQTWLFIVGRFDPSTELALWINGTKTINTTSIPASIFNSASSFIIGAFAGGTGLYTGRSTLNFLCAAYLSDTIIDNLFHQSRALFGV